MVLEEVEEEVEEEVFVVAEVLEALDPVGFLRLAFAPTVVWLCRIVPDSHVFKQNVLIAVHL